MRRHALAAVCIAGVLTGCAREATRGPSAAAPAPPPAVAVTEPRALFAETVALVERGEDAAARTRLTSLLARYPALEDYHLAYLAEIEERAGNVPAATAYTERLLADHPDSVWVPAALVRRARIAVARDEPGALELVARARAAPGADAATRASALLVEADLRAAETPERAYALYQDVRRAGGDAASVAEARSLALAHLHPELLADPALALAEGKLLLAEGRLDLAEAPLATATAGGDAGTRAAALRTLARVRERQGRLEEAVAAFQDADAAEPPPGGTALFELATLLWNRDRDEEARALFVRLLRDVPAHPKRDAARYALGRIAEHEGNQSKALGFYRQLIAAGADAELAREARWRIAWMNYRAGRSDAALRAFADVGRADAADRAGALYWQGRLHERGADARAAATLYREVLERTPESYYAGLAEERLGISLPPPAAPEPAASSPPAELWLHAYHWDRCRELHEAKLDRLATRELDTVARGLRDSDAEPFLLEAYRELDANGRALHLATTLAERGALPRRVLIGYLYPRGYWSLVEPAARDADLDPYLVLALIRQESLFDPEAVSPAAAYGLMQLLVDTADTVAGEPVGPAELTVPATNVRLGTRYLRHLLDRYHADLAKTLAAYNAGEEAVAKWEERASELAGDEFVEDVSFRETRKYVKAVLGNYRRYRRLYGAPAELRALDAPQPPVVEDEGANAFPSGD